MKKFTIIWIGKTGNKAMKALIDDYTKRISHTVKLTIIELKDGMTLEQESAEIKRRLATNAYVFLLDELGKQYNSEELSKTIESLATNGKSHFVFLIGSAYGFSDKTRELADAKLALSKMTFTHEMVRIFLLEQLYRSEMIAKGTGYHH